MRDDAFYFYPSRALATPKIKRIPFSARPLYHFPLSLLRRSGLPPLLLRSSSYKASGTRVAYHSLRSRVHAHACEILNEGSSTVTTVNRFFRTRDCGDLGNFKH